MVNAGLWREYLRSYYASVSYIDEQVGRVLDALEASPEAANTIVVFASDNGYNGGEKNMWAKFALWEQTCRVVFGISGPGVSRQFSETPVSLIDIYPTLVALCALPTPSPQTLDVVNLVSVLNGEKRDRGAPVLTSFGVGNHSITDGRFRYIHYRNGDEEFYDHASDRFEFTNLADNAKFADVKAALAKQLPETDAPEIEQAQKWDGSELNEIVYQEIAEAAKRRHQ